MLRSLFTLAAASTLVATAVAQLPPRPAVEPAQIVQPPHTPVVSPVLDPPAVPVGHGAAPDFLKLSGVSKERRTITVSVKEAVPVVVEKEVTVTVNVDGRLVAEKRKVQVTEYQFVEKKVEMSLKGVQGSDGAGNKLSDDQLWERMVSRKVVLICREREGLDPAYRDVIAKDAVVLIMPVQPIGAAPIPERLPPKRLPPVKD